MTTRTASPPGPKIKVCPFTVVVDSNEGLPYTFQNLWEGPTGGPRSKLIQVPTRRLSLRNNDSEGDYSIDGMIEHVTIERKSKSDLYSSMRNDEKRDNFIGRLERMARMDFAAVMVEAEWYELLNEPPSDTDFKPKSLSRTIQAWMIRYPVHWIMAPNRQYAEAFTFRLLERYWKDQQERPRERFDPGTVAVPNSDPTRDA